MVMARVLHFRLIVLARFDILVDTTDSPEGVDCGFGGLMVCCGRFLLFGFGLTSINWFSRMLKMSKLK